MNTNQLTTTITYALAVFKQRLLGEASPSYNSLTFPQPIINQAFEKFQVTLSFDLKDKLNGRLERGLAIAVSGGVMPADNQGQPNGFYKVVSSNPSNPPYLVDLHRRSCTCPDHWKGHFCKHRIAANIISIANQLSKTVIPPPTARESIVDVQPEIKPIPAVAPEKLDLELPLPKEDATVWGVIQLDGAFLGVEVLSITKDDVTVRALPKIVDGKKLQPQFPFASRLSITKVRKDEISHVKVFQT